jgi:hypothetical protein
MRVAVMKKHPSGRPIHRSSARSWQCGGNDYGQGYRLPKLRDLAGDNDGRCDTQAIGFTADFPVWEEGYDMKGRRK